MDVAVTLAMRVVIPCMFMLVIMMCMIVHVRMAMIVTMMMGFCELAFGRKNINFSRVDATAVNAVQIQTNAELKGIDGLLKDGDRHAGIDQCSEKHVSTDAGEAIQVSNLHHVASDVMRDGSVVPRPMAEIGRSAFMEPLRKPSRSSVTNL
jgi:hypothetical protein